MVRAPLNVQVLQAEPAIFRLKGVVEDLDIVEVEVEHVGNVAVTEGDSHLFASEVSELNGTSSPGALSLSGNGLAVDFLLGDELTVLNGADVNLIVLVGVGSILTADSPRNAVLAVGDLHHGGDEVVVGGQRTVVVVVALGDDATSGSVVAGDSTEVRAVDPSVAVSVGVDVGPAGGHSAAVEVLLDEDRIAGLIVVAGVVGVVGVIGVVAGKHHSACGEGDCEKFESFLHNLCVLRVNNILVYRLQRYEKILNTHLFFLKKN